MSTKVLSYNSPAMTQVLRDKILPLANYHGFEQGNVMVEAMDAMGIKTIDMPTGKLDFEVYNGRHASAGSFGDNYTFDDADLMDLNIQKGVVRSKGFQGNLRIDVIANRRMSTKEAILNIYDNQLPDITKTMQDNYGRMIYADGKGVISTVTADVAAPTGDFVEVKVKNIAKFKHGDILTFKANGTAVVKKVLDEDLKDIDAPDGQDAGFEWKEGTATTTGGSAKSGKGHQEISKNRGATIPTGRFATQVANKMYTAKLYDVDDDNGVLLFKKTAFKDESGTAAPVADLSDAAKGIKDTWEIYYRRSIGEDMHGTDYIIRSHKHDGDGTSGTRGTGLYGIGETEYGTGIGERPRYMDSKIMETKNFIDEQTYMKFIDDLKRRNGAEIPNLYIASPGTRRAVASANQGTGQGIIRAMRDSKDKAMNDQRTLGYGSVDLNGTDIASDDFVTTGELLAVKLETFKIAVEADMQFNDFDGNIWKPIQISGATGTTTKPVLAYRADIYSLREMFNDNPRRNGKIIINTPKVIREDYTGVKTTDIAELGSDMPANPSLTP